jgi:hypothetical protein
MKRNKPSSAPGSPVLGSATKKLKTAASTGGDEASVDAPPTAAVGVGTPGGQDEEGWTKVRKRKDKKQKKVAQRQDVCVSSAPARVREYVTDRLILPFCSLPTSRAYTNPNTWIFFGSSTVTLECLSNPFPQCRTATWPWRSCPNHLTVILHLNLTVRLGMPLCQSLKWIYLHHTMLRRLPRIRMRRPSSCTPPPTSRNGGKPSRLQSVPSHCLRDCADVLLRMFETSSFTFLQMHHPLRGFVSMYVISSPLACRGQSTDISLEPSFALENRRSPTSGPSPRAPLSSTSTHQRDVEPEPPSLRAGLERC